MTGNLRNSKMSIKVILVQEEQSNSLKSLKCYARTEVPGEPAANNENKSTSFHIPTSLFFPLLLQSRWTLPVLGCVLPYWLTHQWHSTQLFKFHSCLSTGTKCHLRKCLCNKHIGRDWNKAQAKSIKNDSNWEYIWTNWRSQVVVKLILPLEEGWHFSYTYSDVVSSTTWTRNIMKK